MQGAASCCTSRAGASPVSVSNGAPSSRPQASGEIPVARAGCRKPLRREQARGPQLNVKPAASTDLQSESRAAHVTAKAMFRALPSGVVGAWSLGGVWGCKERCGTRETRLRGPSRGKLARISGMRNRAVGSGSPRGSWYCRSLRRITQREGRVPAVGQVCPRNVGWGSLPSASGSHPGCAQCAGLSAHLVSRFHRTGDSRIYQ